jgi:heterodisulfide reductase subunit C
MKFGYTIQEDNQINVDGNSMDLFYAVKKKEPTLLMCMACGTCSATCSAAQFTDFSLRQVILRVMRGETKRIEREVEKCMLCGKCHLACPRGVNTRNIILAIRSSLQSQKTD